VSVVITDVCIVWDWSRYWTASVCESVRMTEILNLIYVHMQFFASYALASLPPVFISRDETVMHVNMLTGFHS